MIIQITFWWFQSKFKGNTSRWIESSRKDVATERFIQFGSHQWIQAYLGKAFYWFSREVFELQTNQYQFSHPHSKNFNMSMSDFYFDQRNTWYKTKHDFEPFIWAMRKNFAVEKFYVQIGHTSKTHCASKNWPIWT